jgi:hypothetical protein
MADIQFDEEQQYQQQAAQQMVTQKPFFVRLVLKTGIVHDDKQAEYVLLGFAALGIIFSLFLLFGGGNTPQKPSAVMLEQIGQMPVNRQL